MRARLAKLSLLALVALAVTASGALAYWATGGSGSGTAPTASLTKPVVTVPSGTVGGDIDVSWSASELVPSIAAANSQIDYTVERSANAGTNWTAACGGNTISGTTCSDAVGASGNYIYRVTAHLNSWTELSANSTSVARKPDKPVVQSATGTTTTATVTGTAEPGSTVTLFTDSGCTTPASNATGTGDASGVATGGGTFSIQSQVPAGQQTTFWAQSTANSLTSDCSDTSASYNAPGGTPPTVTAGQIAKAEGLPHSTAGFIRGLLNLGTYRAYANVTAGTSSVALVTANLTGINGAPAVSLAACTTNCTVNNVTYGYVSEPVTAVAATAGVQGFSVTATDTAAQSHTLGTSAPTSALKVTVDNTAPFGTTISATNGGSESGQAEAGDKLNFGYSEGIDGISLVSGWNWPWTAASTDVRVTLVDGGGSINDSLTIASANGSTTPPFGTLALSASGYVSGGNAVFGGTGAATQSTVSISGSTVTITLGTKSGAGTPGDINGNQTISWTPAVGANAAYDAAGNRLVANAGGATRTNSARQF